MLQKETFNQCYLIANKILGYDKPIEAASLNAMYTIMKDLIDEEEFKAITKKVIAECKSYGQPLPPCEWINRRQLNPELKMLIEDMIKSIPSIVANMDYDKLALEHWIENHFTEVQKSIAKESVFLKAINDYRNTGSIKGDVVKDLSVVVLQNNTQYYLEKNENKLLTDK
mgnify:CR=1 FL=1